MPNRNKPVADGYGGASTFCPQKWMCTEHVQTMPCRKALAYGGGVLGVTPDSDVTQKTKAMTNAGATAAAGVGARCRARTEVLS